MPRRYLDRRAEAEIEAMLARGDLARAKDAGESAAGQSTGQRGAAAQMARRAVGDWHNLVEQRILDGMERGLFDNLRGMGQPLNLDEDRFVPEDLRMAFQMLRSTGLAPLWVELNKEIRQDIERMHRFRRYVHSRWERMSSIERSHLRNQYEERIQEINGKIVNYNIIAPSSYVHLGLLIVSEELATFDAGPC